MRVAFVVNDLQLSGGITVVVEHCRRLARLSGWEVSLVLARERDDRDWLGYPDLEPVRVIDRNQAAAERFDIAVATWWETAYALFQLEADHYAYFVQSLEDRFYLSDQAGRKAAALTLDLPVAFITEATWIRDLLRALRPDAPCFLVRNGIDKSVFTAPQLQQAMTGHLRVLVEGSADVWFKGVPEAVAAVEGMTERHELTVVTNEPADVAPLLGPHSRAVGPLSQAELAATYRSHDVLVKLSRVEGVYSPPLEAFHCGATVVTTPVTGHDEYIIHGYNGLVCEWDDPRGVARALDLLARNRRYLTYLRYNALRTAAAWPSWEQASLFMQAALRSIARLPPTNSSLTGKRLIEDIRMYAAIDAEHLLERAAFHRRAMRYEQPISELRQTPIGELAARLAHKQSVRKAAKRVLQAARRFGTKK